MKPRLRYIAPDGTDWRDPNMFVYINGQQYCACQISQFARRELVMSDQPVYREDVTYNMRRK